MHCTNMACVPLACLLLIALAGAQAKEKQIKLEDIERDTLAAERHAKAAKQIIPSYHHSAGGHYYVPNVLKTYQTQALYEQQPPEPPQQRQQLHRTPFGGTPTPPKMQYGFVPTKLPTPAPYHYQVKQQQQPEQAQYHAGNYIRAPLKSPGVQYVLQQPEVAPPQRYAVPIQTQAYQKYTQFVPEYQQQNPHRQPPAHVRYVVDNSIQSDVQPPPAHQQFVYLQPLQTPAASNSNVQYVMFIPAAGASSAATYAPEALLAYPTNQETEYVYQTVVDNGNASDGEDGGDGVAISTPSHDQFVPPPPPPPRRFERPLFKHQPTSLLDSYVPSYLQYQYYKQQADTANAIQHSLKSSAGDVGKTDVVKAYKDGVTINY